MHVRPGPPDPSLLAPGGRPPAPGALAVVQALLNTRNDELANDGLADPARTRAFLARNGLPGADGPHAADADGAADVRALREALRALVDGSAGAAELAVLDRAADAARLTLRLGRAGAPLVPAADGVAGALGHVLAAVHAARADGTWERLKPCRECAFLFYDQSRNRSGAWCAMAVCGNRLKTRRYRSARRQMSPP